MMGSGEGSRPPRGLNPVARRRLPGAPERKGPGSVFGLRLFARRELPTMAIAVPNHVLEAAREGRMQFVLEHLARRPDWPIDRVGRMMLRACCGQRTNGQPRDIQSKHVDLARALLDRGADPKPRNSLGWTPLQYAARGLGDASVDVLKTCKPAARSTLLDTSARQRFSFVSE